METLIDLIVESAEAFGDRPALVCRAGLRDDPWTYKRLHGGVHAAAHHLRFAAGLRPGDRVLVCAQNCPQLVAGYLGAMLARVILVPLDPFSTRDFIDRIAKETEASAFIAGDSMQPIPELRHIKLFEIPFDAVAPPFDEPPKDTDVAEVVFTSGTTGKPKGVVLTHNNIVSNIQSARGIFPKRHHWRFLSLLPLSHMLEQTVGLFLPLQMGATIYYPVGRQSALIIKSLKRYRIVAVVCVPEIVAHLLNGIEREVRQAGNWSRWERAHWLARHLSMRMRRLVFRKVHKQLGRSLRYFICGGAHLPPELSQSWERMGVTVSQGYGATECSPVIAAIRSTGQAPGSVGRVIPGVQIRVSEECEVQVRGANVFSGYWCDEKATENSFTEDGWYRTGDLAATDRQGFLHLKGRLKDMIVLSSGMNVFPEDVESVLVRQDGIKDCVVLGLEDPSGNVRITAAVLPAKRGPDQLATQKLAEVSVRSANMQLAPHQRITSVRVWQDEDFPRTALEKVKRHEVRAMIEGRAPKTPASTCLPAQQERPVTHLQRILAEVSGAGVASITMDSDLNLDLGLTSLSRVELALVLEKEFGVSVDDGEFAELNTVAQLVELIDRGQSAAQPVSCPAWPLSLPARVIRTILQQTLVFPVHRLLARPFAVEGAEHLENLNLPAVFIANHSSHVDTVSIVRALPSWVRCKLGIAAATDYFYRYRWFGFINSLLLNTFPFSREGAVRSSFEHCGELVDSGWSLLIYPEGTRSPTGELLPFKRGIGLLASELGIPVVPIGVKGGHKILPKNSIIPRPGPVTLRIGRPIELSKSKDVERTVSLLQEGVARLLAPAKPVIRFQI